MIARSDAIPSGTFHALQNPEEYAGIRRAIEKGRELLNNPEIADEFREGSTLETIASTHLPEISPSIGRTAVSYALKGYDGNLTIFNESSYDGLIPLAEYDALAKQHRLQGIAQQQENNVGIFAQTTEEQKAAGNALAEKTGVRIWTDEELELLLDCATNPTGNYTHGSRISAKKISAELAKQGFDRDPNSVKKMIHRINTGERST